MAESPTPIHPLSLNDEGMDPKKSLPNQMHLKCCSFMSRACQNQRTGVKEYQAAGADYWEFVVVVDLLSLLAFFAMILKNSDGFLLLLVDYIFWSCTNSLHIWCDPIPSYCLACPAWLVLAYNNSRESAPVG